MSTLDNLKKEAKHWLKALRANDAEARARLARAYPGAPVAPGLRDVQHALAREHGHESWKAFTAAIAAGRPGTPLEALLRAAEQGDAARVAAILDTHRDIVNQRGILTGHTGLRTALHFGVEHGPVVAALLERGADPNIRDEGDNAIPLHFAAEREDLAVIRLLVEHGSDLIGDGHELQIIGWATCFGKGRQDVVDYLLAHGARHNIFSAVAMGEVETIREIVSRSPETLDTPMDRTNHRRRPIHLAVVRKQAGALAALIDLGADLDARDAAGMTALDQAALDGESAMAQLLIDRGATLELPAAIGLQRSDDIERLLRQDRNALRAGFSRGTLLISASAKASGAVIDTLIRYGAAVNATADPKNAVDEAEGYTALHAAAWNGNADAVRALLEHGADPMRRDAKYPGTPAGWADFAGHPEVRDLILQGPIDLFDAIRHDRPDRIPEILARDPGALTRPFGQYLPHGAKTTDEEPGRSMTPLEWAVGQGKTEAARILAEHAEKQKTAVPDPAARFLQLACWDHHVHGKGDHRMYDRAAQRLLAEHPEIARRDIYTAVVCGEIDEVRRLLAERSEAIREAGGSRRWTPLLYLCYARFTHRTTIDNAEAIARLMLDHGADPNDYYMAGDSWYTALVGAAGEGEQDSPRQPWAEAVYRLLLERGAGPYDIQVLYNTHFSGDMIWWLELTYQHSVRSGVKADWDDPAWAMLDMGGYGPGAYFVLNTAVKNDDVGLAEWALSHGASPNIRASGHRKFRATWSLLDRARMEGLTAMATLLERYGAKHSDVPLEPEQAFIAACMRLDRPAVEAMLAEHPEYRTSPQAMFAAAKRDRVDVLAMLLDLGVPLEVSDEHRTRALHHAGLQAAKFLVERGAEIDPRESSYGATPIGWAAHGDDMEKLAFLSQHSRNIWTLTFRGFVDRLRELLRSEPGLAKEIDEDDGSTPLWWLPDDEDKALAIVELLLAAGADPSAKNKAGRTAADWARTRGMIDVARRLDRAASMRG